MGGLALIPTIASTLATAGTVINVAKTLSGNDKQTNLAVSQQAQQTALQQQQVATQNQQANEERQAALRRAMARTRAQLGAQGVNSVGGSGEAVLLGLYQESEADQTRRNNLDKLRQTALSQEQDQFSSRNLLAQQERQERAIFSRGFLGNA